MRKVQSPKSNVRNLKLVVSSLLRWFAANARDLPWRRTRDPYAIWVSEIMLQQTQVKTVIPYFERWIRELPTVHALAEASSDRIHKLWEGLGYYTRVRNMQQAARQIVDKHAAKFPTEFYDVLSLPGIGRYTAGAICSIAFNQPTPILDGNVIRVLTRLFGIRENAREKRTNARLWNLATEFVTCAARLRSPAAGNQACSALNQSLMELGATVCTPRAPRCDLCPVNRCCVARAQNCQESLPNLAKRAATTRRRFAAVVVQRNGCALVRQRTGNVVNAHLWEFPNIEIAANATQETIREALQRELGCGLESMIPLCAIRHTITRYRITLDVFTARLNGSLPRRDSGTWKQRQFLAKLAFTSAHRRVAEHIRRSEAHRLHHET